MSARIKHSFTVASCILVFSTTSLAQTSVYLQDPSLSIGYVDSCAQFWLEAWDDTYGGFYTDVNRYGSVTGTHKNMLTQTRDAYGMVRAFQLTGDTLYLTYAHAALEWMIQHAWDNARGGWYSVLGENGNVLNPTADRSAFDQHYALLGLAAYVEATGDTAMMSMLLDGYDHLENVYWDDREGFKGYYDVAAFDGTNARNKSFNATVDAITTHLLLLQLMTGQPHYLERLEQLSDQVIDHLVGSMPQQAIGFAEVYDSNWNINENETMTIMGHVLKASWCLSRVHRITGDPELVYAAETLFHDVWENGYDHELGGPYKDYNRITGEMLMWGNPDTTKAWWQMEQGVMAGLMLNGLITAPHPLVMADGTIDFFMEHFVDHQYGEIYADRTRYGDETWGTTKGNGYKAAYHSIETGYYSYLYGSLLLQGQPATLYYQFEPRTEAREITFTPIAIQDDHLVIGSVSLNGEIYSAFDPETRTLTLAPDTGGIFAVTFETTGSTVAWQGTQPHLPTAITIESVYPNPFNSTAHIAFTLQRPGPVQLHVYSIDGREVLALPSQSMPAGSHQLPLQMRNVATGTYLVRLGTADSQQATRIVLVK